MRPHGRGKHAVIPKFLPLLLWLVAWQAWSLLPAMPALHLAAGTRGLDAAMVTVPPPPVPEPLAVDDFRIDVHDGVTADSYRLEPQGDLDPARTQSLVDGISGRAATRAAPVVDTDIAAGADDGLPAPAAAALWLAGLIAVVWMAIRHRR